MATETVKMQTIYWRDGKRDVFPGETGAQALSKAGYGHGAVSAVDFICDGDNDEYEWNATERRWKSRAARGLETTKDE